MGWGKPERDELFAVLSVFVLQFLPPIVTREAAEEYDILLE